MQNAPTRSGIRSLTWNQWLSLYCALAFTVLGIDASMNHHAVFLEYPFSFTPAIFSPLALAASLVTAFSSAWRRKAWILAIVAIAVGLAGLAFHNNVNFSERGTMTLWETFINSYKPPALAPAAFASTGLLLFLIAWGEYRKK